jgi:hypothetical protein
MKRRRYFVTAGVPYFWLSFCINATMILSSRLPSPTKPVRRKARQEKEMHVEAQSHGDSE